MKNKSNKCLWKNYSQKKNSDIAKGFITGEVVTCKLISPTVQKGRQVDKGISHLTFKVDVILFFIELCWIHQLVGIHVWMYASYKKFIEHTNAAGSIKSV